MTTTSLSTIISPQKASNWRAPLKLFGSTFRSFSRVLLSTTALIPVRLERQCRHGEHRVVPLNVGVLAKVRILLDRFSPLLLLSSWLLLPVAWAEAQTVLPSGTNEVVLTGYPTGNPFTIASGTTISPTSNRSAIFGDSSQIWTLNTDGTIANNTIGYVSGVQFDNGGSVANGMSNPYAQISAYGNGILIGGANPATVNNGGRILGGFVAGGAAISFLNGGTITNLSTGVISAGVAGNPAVRIAGSSGSVDNSGLISADANGYGTYMTAGGSVINRAGATITAGASGNGGYGVWFSGGSGSVENSGTVSGGQYGIYGGNALTVTNQATATISGNFSGVATSDIAAISNAGTISGGVYGIVAGVPNSGKGFTLANSGLIAGSNAGVSLSTGSNATVAISILNLAGGKIRATGAGSYGITTLHGSTVVTNQAGATIAGSGAAIAGMDLFTDLVVQNAGSISGGTAAGIWSYGGGEITNQAGATITGAGGVAYVRSRYNTGNILTNAGAIDATSFTFVAGNGATAGAGAGVYIGGVYKPVGAQVNNLVGGSIAGTVYGIYSGGAFSPDDAGPVTVTNAGAISGITGISFNSAVGTVVNTGTITGYGGTAIQFDQGGAFPNSVTLGTGSVLNGNVLGGAGNDALILQGSNSENAGKFVNFETLSMQGVDWTLSGAGIFSTGSEIANGILRVLGTLTSPALTVQSAGTLAGTGTVVGNVENFGTVSPGNSIGTLTVVGNYVGQNGILAIESVLAADNSPADVLAISGGKATGTTNMVVTNLGGQGDLTTGNGILVVDALNGATTAPSAFSLRAPAVAGPYEYSLFRGSADTSGLQSWYLRSDLTPVPPTPPVPPLPPEPPVPPSPTPHYRQEVSLYAAIQPMAAIYGRHLIDSLHERVGEEEQLQGSSALGGVPSSGGGGWGRFIGHWGHRDGDAQGIYGGAPEFSYGFGALQTGLDVYRKENSNGTRDHAGLYFAFGHGEVEVTHTIPALGAKFKAGNDNFDAITLGGYWTRFGENNWYLDGVVQGTWYDVVTHSLRDTLIGFPDQDVSGFGLAMSLEGGYPFDIGGNWKLEPQAQVIYQNINFDSFNDSAANVSFDRYNSLLGRVGTRLSRTWTSEVDPRLQRTFWGQINVWHEFLGDTTTSLSSASGPVAFSASLDETFIEFSVGGTRQLTPSTSFYANANFETTFDARSYGIDGKMGLRVNW
ncbi:autotransporter outer membrane beta-barrel domain-containing protein [Phyllobacterium calauticae]|uniref:autotransporter outer membrane beta-barrel domain-containing protein n=1 Tax=Phyllobacterium calauticae TaxID=2817027 RepID=UPI001CBF02F5|nr:autotransporter outer membrane beta-barrel domain-containing protein [Phyllobacterium calauticae]MBZ3691933.1 autotransporter outer membrane beta-barrel domain-containing protein [Phyllobacterium calauticae]